MQTAMEDGRVAKNPCSIRSAGREEPVERPMITLEQLDASSRRGRTVAEPDRDGGMVWAALR